jgi:hypothetical protein
MELPEYLDMTASVGKTKKTMSSPNFDLAVPGSPIVLTQREPHRDG